ncbi:hypothetical protein [Halomonas aquatica]|uniref:Uncharacterized protein n=1 Tax=Halomonas aquatica TaxID=3151123 RepID=A0ABV1NB53_9GAMM
MTEHDTPPPVPEKDLASRFPTAFTILFGLAIGRVSYDRWIAFIWPLLVLTLFISVVISIGTLF